MINGLSMDISKAKSRLLFPRTRLPTYTHLLIHSICPILSCPIHPILSLANSHPKVFFFFPLLLRDDHLTEPITCKYVFPFLPDPLQFLDIDFVHLVDVVLVRLELLLYFQWLPNHDIQRASIGHQAYVIVEDSSSVEEGNRKSQQLLHHQLCFVNERMVVWLHDVV